MRPLGSAKVLEARRRRALALVQQGRSLNAAARRIGCAASSVMRWLRAFRRRGPEGLKVQRASGRPPRLPARYRPLLLKQLLRGAMAHGYPTDLW
ncbi:MAG: helix-turn-helix domain-containing protein, partial [bacterium]|nr:helix-turn-helix domain-containing protein [bacterium]